MLRLDLMGMGIVTLGLVLLVYPLVQGQDTGWSLWVFVSMALSIPIMVLFAYYERYKNQKDGSPLVVPGLFRQRAFVAGLLVNLFVS